jgi:hypothetical protein
MAKGQMKSNKEKKKQKADVKQKPVSAYKAAQGLGSSTTSSTNNPFQKKT